MIDRYALHDEYLAREDVANYDKTIQPIAHPIVALKPHVSYADKPSMVIMSLYLSSLDRENAAFIIEHAKEINEML